MFAFLAPAALKLLFGRALGGAASGIKSAGHWLGSLDLVHALLLVTALFGAWQTVGRWVQHRHTAKVEAQLLAATNALTTPRANVTTLKVEVAKQNTAVADLGTKSAQQQKAGAQASQVAAGRANEAQATSDRLKQSSRSTGLKSAPACEPSDALKGQWQ